MILTEKKSTQAFTLEIGTISLNELPEVMLTWLKIKNHLGVYQQNYKVFCSTLASPLVDGEALNVHYLI
jgi:hypothetical protein